MRTLMIPTMDDTLLNQHKQDYVFILYGEGILKDYGDNAQKFLFEAQSFLLHSEDLIDDRILLAKAQSENHAVLLFVDRDTFELTFRDFRGTRHLAMWQATSEWKGKSLKELEYFMVQFLFDRNAVPYHDAIPAPHKEFWEEGEDPAYVRQMEDMIEDSLI